MNIADIILILLLAANILNGLKKGFINQLLQSIAIIISPFLAYKLAGMATRETVHLLKIKEEIAFFICFIVILGIIMCFFLLLAYLLTSFVKIMLLGWVNRLCGALFGGLKFLFILMIAVHVFCVIIRLADARMPDFLLESKIFCFVKSISNFK